MHFKTMKNMVFTRMVTVQSQISNMPRKKWIHQFCLRGTSGQLHFIFIPMILFSLKSPAGNHDWIIHEQPMCRNAYREEVNSIFSPFALIFSPFFLNDFLLFPTQKKRITSITSSLPNFIITLLSWVEPDKFTLFYSRAAFQVKH